MAKQLQVRRGVEQAQNLFTGAEGEITMTTDTKELRIHDGTKVGGFRVPTLVAVQYPSSANNYTWYRKYSDGWVEQGGKKTNANDMVTVDLPVTMADANYFATKTITSGSTTAINANVEFVTHLVGIEQKTVSSFKTQCWSNYGITEFYWEVKGLAA